MNIQVKAAADITGISFDAVPEWSYPIFLRCLPSHREYAIRLKDAQKAGKYFGKRHGFQGAKLKRTIKLRKELELERILRDIKGAQELMQARGLGDVIPLRLKLLSTHELEKVISDVSQQIK